MTRKPKIYGVTSAVEAPPTGGKGFRRRVTRWYPYVEESEVGSDIHGDKGVTDFWEYCRMCFFDVYIVGTDTESYDGIHPQKIQSQHEQNEIQHHFMPLVLSLDRAMGEEKKSSTNQLSIYLSNKWDMEYLATCEYARSCLSLNLVWAFSLQVQGPCSGKPW